MNWSVRSENGELSKKVAGQHGVIINFIIKMDKKCQSMGVIQPKVKLVENFREKDKTLFSTLPFLFLKYLKIPLVGLSLTFILLNSTV